MCDYCEPDGAGNLKWLREDAEQQAWLEESGGEWAIVMEVNVRCCGTDCTTESYVSINNCPMCGRKLRGDAE